MSPASAADVTASVQNLGNPFKGYFTRDIYARNVWDMQVWDGKIYLGYGDLWLNAGPIPVWSLDPATNTYSKEFTVNEEAIDHYEVVNGMLYIPGSDTRTGV